MGLGFSHLGGGGRGAAVTPPAFTPASLSPNRWGEARAANFQSNAGTTAAAIDTDPVGYYTDLSGSAVHLTSAANDTTRPTLQGTATKPFLRFDGSNDILRYMGGALGSYAAGSTSWFMAAKFPSVVANTVLMSEGSTASNPYYAPLTASSAGATIQSARLNNGANILDGSSAVLANALDANWHVIGIIDNGSTLTPVIDGISGAPLSYTRSGSFAALNQFGLGGLLRGGSGSLNAAFDLAGEVLVNRVLTATEIANLSAYLATLFKVPNTSLYLVSNRSALPTGVGSVAQDEVSIIDHYSPADGDITSIQTVDVGFYLGPANSDARTISRKFEYPSGSGTFVDIAWSAASSKTIGVGLVVKSDVIPFSVPAGGVKYREHTTNLNALVTNFPLIVLPANKSTLGVDDGAANTKTFGAAAILGTTSAPCRSFILPGDSLDHGQGDISGVGAKESSGFLGRALDVHGYSYVKVAAPGWRASIYVTGLVKLQAFIDAINFTDVICELGVNDLSGGDSQTLLMFNLQRVYKQMGYYGATIKQTTLTPKTTTPGPPTTSGNMGALTAVNAAIRALPNQVSAVIEAADAAMTSRDSNLWPVGATGDDVHPTSAKAALMAAAIAASL